MTALTIKGITNGYINKKYYVEYVTGYHADIRGCYLDGFRIHTESPWNALAKGSILAVKVTGPSTNISTFILPIVNKDGLTEKFMNFRTQIDV